MKNFKNKVVVIAGAGSGIGRALAVSFAKSGAKLAVNDFNATALNETCSLVKQENAEVIETSFDVSNRVSMTKFAEEVVKYYGLVDVVVNNAGIGYINKMIQQKLEFIRLKSKTI